MIQMMPHAIQVKVGCAACHSRNLLWNFIVLPRHDLQPAR